MSFLSDRQFDEILASVKVLPVSAVEVGDVTQYLFDSGEAHGVCRHAKATKRPLDILAGTLKMFEDGKSDTGFVEREIHRTE